VPQHLRAEDLRDLLFLAAQRFSLRRSAPSRVKKSALSGRGELQTTQTDAYRRSPVVAAEINWDTLAGRFIEARTRRCVTRRQASRRAGYQSETTVRRYESGAVAEPREDVVGRFAKALGCDPMWLMYGRGDPAWSEDWA
jgi:hypothetical protein